MEDFTTFTEYDPNSKRTIDSATEISIANLDNDDNGYVKKDYGENYFNGDFQIDLDIWYQMSYYDVNARCCIFALTDSSNTIQEMSDNSDGLSLEFYRDDSYNVILKNHNTGDTDTFTLGSASISTEFYCTFYRSGTTVRCYIFYDSDRETLIDVLYLTCSNTYRQIVLFGGLDNNTYGSADVSSQYIENLDLNSSVDLSSIDLTPYESTSFAIYKSGQIFYEDMSRVSISGGGTWSAFNPLNGCIYVTISSKITAIDVLTLETEYTSSVGGNSIVCNPEGQLWAFSGKDIYLHEGDLSSQTYYTLQTDEIDGITDICFTYDFKYVYIVYNIKYTYDSKILKYTVENIVNEGDPEWVIDGFHDTHHIWIDTNGDCYAASWYFYGCALTKYNKSDGSILWTVSAGGQNIYGDSDRWVRGFTDGKVYIVEHGTLGLYGYEGSNDFQQRDSTTGVLTGIATGSSSPSNNVSTDIIPDENGTYCYGFDTQINGWGIRKYLMQDWEIDTPDIAIAVTTFGTDYDSYGDPSGFGFRKGYTAAQTIQIYDELALRLGDTKNKIFTRETKIQAYNRAQTRIANFLKPEYIQDLLEIDTDVDISSGEYSLDSLTYSILNERESIFAIKVTIENTEYWAYEIDYKDIERLSNSYYLPDASIFYYIFENKIYFKTSSDLSLPVPELEETDDEADFTEFNEYDPNSVRTVTATKITLDDLTRGDDGYIIKDYGEDNFSADFEYTLTVNIGSQYDLYTTICPIAFTNGSLTIQDMLDNSEGLAVYFYRNDNTTRTIYLQDFGGSSDTYTNFSTNTTYYLTVSRSGSTCYCYIYSDEDRETLVDTLSISCSTAYRYMVVTVGREGSNYTSNDCDGYVEDLTGNYEYYESGATADIYLLKVPDTITEYADTIYADVASNLSSELYELFVTMAEYYCWEMEGNFKHSEAIKKLSMMQLDTLNWKFKASPEIIMGV